MLLKELRLAQCVAYGHIGGAEIIGTVNGWIWLVLYHTAQALESVFMAVLKLFGFFANLIK